MPVRQVGLLLQKHRGRGLPLQPYLSGHRRSACIRAGGPPQAAAGGVDLALGYRSKIGDIRNPAGDHVGGICGNGPAEADALGTQAEGDLPACGHLLLGRHFQAAEGGVQQQATLLAAGHLAGEEIAPAKKAGNEFGPGPLVEVGGAVDLLNPAITKNCHPVGHGKRLLLVMGDVEEGGADPPVDGLELCLKRLEQRLVEGAEGLIQKQHCRFENQRPGQGHTLLLPAGKLARLAPGDVAELDEIKGRFDLGTRLTPGDPSRAQRGVDILPDRQVGEERGALEDHAEVALLRRQRRDVAPAQEHASAGGLDKARDRHQQGRLARTGGTEQGQKLARMDGEVRRVQGVHRPVGLVDVPNFQRALHPLPDSCLVLLTRARNNRDHQGVKPIDLTGCCLMALDKSPLNAHRALPFLRAFEAVARLGQVRSSAAEMNLTPGAVSHQIRSLERLLGVELFAREARRLRLSPKGQEFRARIAPLLRDLDLAVGALGVKDEIGPTTLRISTPPGLGHIWLAPRLFDMAEHLGIQSFETRFAREMTQIDWRQVDVAIVYDNPPWPGYRWTPLANLELRPVCSPQLFNAGLPLRTPRDIIHHQLLHEDTGEEWQRWLHAARLKGTAVRNAYFNMLSMAFNAALAGQGLALVSDLLADVYLRSGQLMQPFSISIPSARNYYCVTLESRAEETLVRQSVLYLLQTAAASRGG